MASTFQFANEEVGEIARSLIMKNHLDLDSVAAKIDFVFAFRDPDGEAPALMHQGHRALGLASISKLKDRVKGMGDCEVLLDGDAWQDMSHAMRMALLDHELEHFEVKRNPKNGDFLWDDINRPLLKMKLHDRQFGWFDNIAARHGAASFEVQQLRELFVEAGDSYTPHLRGNVVDIYDLPAQETPSEPEETDRTTVEISADGVPTVTTSLGGLKAIAAALSRKSQQP